MSETHRISKRHKVCVFVHPAGHKKYLWCIALIPLLQANGGNSGKSVFELKAHDTITSVVVGQYLDKYLSSD